MFEMLKWSTDDKEEIIVLIEEKTYGHKEALKLRDELIEILKKKKTCPKCSSTRIIMFSADDDICQDCNQVLPGI